MAPTTRSKSKSVQPSSMRRNLKQNTSETKFKGIKDDVAETANLRAPSKLLTSSKSKSKRVTKRVTNNTHRLTVKRGGKQKPTKETISTEKKPSKKEKTKKNEPGERKFKNKMSEGDEPQEKGPKKTPKVERKARGEGIWVGDRWINTGFDAIW